MKSSGGPSYGLQMSLPFHQLGLYGSSSSGFRYAEAQKPPVQVCPSLQTGPSEPAHEEARSTRNKSVCPAMMLLLATRVSKGAEMPNAVISTSTSSPSASSSKTISR